MDGYPNSDEEFELTYGDDLELIRTSQEPAPKSKHALPNHKGIQILENVEITSKKRQINELFGDIDDLYEQTDEIQLPRAKKLKDNSKDANVEAYAVIEHILELRNEAKQRNQLTFQSKHTNSTYFNENLTENLSTRPPNWPFLPCTTPQGERLYIRTHSKEFFNEQMQIHTDILRNSTLADGLSTKFDEVWEEAIKMISNEQQPEAADERHLALDDVPVERLWVEIYKPRKYVELLSDESTNRTLLRWLKLWDRQVFNKRAQKVKFEASQKWHADFFSMEAEGRRPKYKVALLCGAPGLGKTTLAHLVAQHCGYNVLEVNASDERTVDSFRNYLINATTMTSVVDRDKRPNCLIFDEIDGAPQASINFLVKFCSDAYVIANKTKGKKSAEKLQRPVLCICNDPYVPALRQLRQMAFVVHFQKTNSQRLTQRLSEISQQEGVKVNRGALMALSEKSHNDIRSCLGVLQFLRISEKLKNISESRQTGLQRDLVTVKLEDILKLDIGQKDIQKSLFAIWNDIFFIERSRSQVSALGDRWRKIIDSLSGSFGDYDKLALGVFENYPTFNVRDSTMGGAVEALEWFCEYDVCSSKVQQLQNYSLSQYLSYSFVVWHYVFGNFQSVQIQNVKQEKGQLQNAKVRIQYPRVGMEIRQNVQKTDSVLQQLLRFMSPSVSAYATKTTLLLDVLPVLQRAILNPQLRPVNLHLFTPKEKEALAGVVNAMIDYGLNYLQERNAEGSYVFNLDPNIEELVKFGSFGKQRRTLIYSNRQLVAREIEVENMRRSENAMKQNAVRRQPSQDSVNRKPEVPNHLQQLIPKNIAATKQVNRNVFSFFTKTQTSNETNASSNQHPSDDSNSDDTEIYYQFKEGHTNAVKKNITISQLY